MSRSRSQTGKSDHQIDLFAEDIAAETPTIPAAGDTTFAMKDLLSSPDKTETLLLHWQQAEWIRALDVGFARLIRELSEEQGERPDPLLLLLAALVSHQVGRGHVCVDLGNLLADAGRTLSLPPEESVQEPLTDPGTSEPDRPKPADVLALVTLPECLSTLEGACAVSDGSHTTPLVLNGTRLYLRRFWRYEQRIAAGIRHRLALPSPLADPESGPARTLSLALDTLFRSSEPVDYQKLACALTARNHFAVITGGPGTGKTTTVVKLLAALQAIAGASPERQGRKYRIRLAAPTGKAAARRRLCTTTW